MCITCATMTRQRAHNQFILIVYYESWPELARQEAHLSFTSTDWPPVTLLQSDRCCCSFSFPSWLWVRWPIYRSWLPSSPRSSTTGGRCHKTLGSRSWSAPMSLTSPASGILTWGKYTFVTLYPVDFQTLVFDSLSKAWRTHLTTHCRLRL